MDDPDIPHIPWNELEIKERIGVGSTSFVMNGFWTYRNERNEIVKEEVAMKELIIGNKNYIDETLLPDLLIEIKLMRYFYFFIIYFLFYSILNYLFYCILI